MKTAIVIPARFKSTRFPGKPLVSICGKPMIIWVAELCSKAIPIKDIYIATEDQRIADIVHAQGFQAIMTGDDALTGTDRIAQAANNIDANIIINVQGDEPLLNPKDILSVLEAKISNPNEIINAFAPLDQGEDPDSVNIPKVIFTEDRRMVYMSRRALPGFKSIEKAPKNFFKQVCIYAFTKEEVMRFGAYGRKSTLEESEDIEILRFLEWGKVIRLVETSMGSVAVDIPSDVAIVESRLKNNK